MTYNKTIWQPGDKITAEKMNKIEEGLVNSEGIEPIMIPCDNSITEYADSHLSNTYSEILNAFLSGKNVYAEYSSADEYQLDLIKSFNYDEDQSPNYLINIFWGATSADDYPIYPGLTPI